MKTKKSIRKIFSSAFLAAVVLATSLQLPFLTTSAGAETVIATAVTTAPDTEIVGIDSFTDENFTQNFKAWGSKKPTAEVSNGVLKVTGSGDTGDSRSAAYMVQTATLNQYVSMTVETTSGEKITPVLWLRAQEYDRKSSNGDDIVPIGYLVKAVINESNYVNVQLFKSAVVDGTFKGDQILYYDDAKTDKVETKNINLTSSIADIGLMDLKIEAYVNYDVESKTDVIWVNVYKVNKTSGVASIVKTLRYENTSVDDEYLMKAGWAGFAAMGSTNQLAVKSFDYHSTDTGFDKTLYATESFTDYSDNMTAFGNNTKASVSDNTLIIYGTGLDNDRDAAQVLKKAAQNLSVEATIKTPHTIVNGIHTYVTTAPVVWLKSFEFTRSDNTKALAGYFISTSFNDNSDSATVTLFKQTYNDSNVLQSRAPLATVNVDTYSNYSSKFCDITYKADIEYISETGATDITVYVYKDTTKIDAWTMTASDTDAKLSGAGSAGLSAQRGSATFTKFAVKTQAEALQPAYAQVAGARDNTMLAQAVTVDTTATYRFSAVVSCDFTETPLCIAYKTSSGVVLKEFKPSDEAMTDKHYLRYTYDVDMSALGVSDTLVYVGVKMQPIGSTPNELNYSEFEFRKVTGDTVGANLIFNGDFKMGCCGWTSDTDSIANSISLLNPRTVDSAKFELSNKRFAYYRETNLVNYQRNFINDYYMGDINEDSYFDIRDLVALNNGIANGEYLIFGDLDNDNTLAVSDLAQLRSDLLSGKNDSKNR